MTPGYRFTCLILLDTDLVYSEWGASEKFSLTFEGLC